MALSKSQRKLFLLLAAGGALACIIAVVQFGSSAHAQAGSPTTCSDATVSGPYAWYATGSSKSPFAKAGNELFDGHGHSHGFYSISVNGTITRHLSFTGSYAINPDCTGTETITDSTGAVTHYDDYYLPSGDQLEFVRTDSGVVSAGRAER